MLHNVKIYQILALLFSKPTRKQFMYYVKFQTLTHRLRNVRIMQHRHTTERITKQLPEHHSWPFEKQMSLLKTGLTLEFFCRRFSWVFSVVWWITIIFVLPQKYCKRKMFTEQWHSPISRFLSSSLVILKVNYKTRTVKTWHSRLKHVKNNIADHVVKTLIWIVKIDMD